MNKYNVFGVGNALVDFVTRAEDDFLKENKIRKGVMTLVDSADQSAVLEKLHNLNPLLRSGGSAANTMIGIANCGGTGCYTGKVSTDRYGAFYKEDMEKAGISFEVPAGNGDTGTCLVITSPDGERTMLTALGISSELHPSDIHLDKLKESEIAYLEGYLWDRQNTKDASVFTMDNAKKMGKKVAYTYSDPFCVHRSREDFIKITKEYVDIAFCNHEEAMALTKTENPEDAIVELGNYCPLVFMTWSSHGCYLSENGVNRLVPGFPVKPIDSNGAGDAFAAGVLYGLTHGFDAAQSAKWGNYVASRVILEIGPRISYSLKGKIHEILGTQS